MRLVVPTENTRPEPPSTASPPYLPHTAVVDISLDYHGLVPDAVSPNYKA